GAYGISDYQQVMQLIRDDPVIAPRLRVLTPSVTLFGIAGNFDIDASKTFFGVGIVPSDRDRMRSWDEYRQFDGQGTEDSGLRDDDETRGAVGVGLARVLGLCESLKLADCPARPRLAGEVTEDRASPASPVLELARRDRETSTEAREGSVPRLDLLAATAGGAPDLPRP